MMLERAWHSMLWIHLLYWWKDNPDWFLVQINLMMRKFNILSFTNTTTLVQKNIELKCLSSLTITKSFKAIKAIEMTKKFNYELITLSGVQAFQQALLSERSKFYFFLHETSRVWGKVGTISVRRIKGDRY